MLRTTHLRNYLKNCPRSLFSEFRVQIILETQLPQRFYTCVVLGKNNEDLNDQ